MKAPLSRRWLVLFAVILLDVLVLQHSGRMTFDTKLGVNLDPAGFYARLWDLWNPLQWFGGIHNQYIGYAFPMLPFYLLTDALHVPVWLAERLWMTLLAATGFWGMVRLCERLGTGRPATRLAAGTVYALWPTFTILIGSTSASILPAMLVPWAVLQLADPSRPPRTAAARAGLVVLCMGGVNAVVTIAALVMPTLWVLVHRRWRLLAWWSLCSSLACLWWLVPLLYQGRYGYDFLPYIETAMETTRTMSAAAVLRGEGNWVAYLVFGTVWLPAGWALVSSAWAVGAASIAAALGLSGLAHRSLPERTWLRCGAALAAVIALAGYGGPLGGPLHGVYQELLDGPLAPMRNVYKWEPVLALVLCVGIAHFLALIDRRAVAAVLAVAILAGLSFPYWSGQILREGSFRDIPRHWYQTAAFLKEHSPATTALVVPADSHGLYSWGQPMDEPLEPLADSPWVQRDLVPFSGGAARDLLEGAERAITSGRAAPGLPAYLARAGIRYVVVRNDLDPSRPDYTPPEPVHDSLEQSGFTRVQAFGRQVYPIRRAGTTTRYPAVEIYEAADPEHRPQAPARMSPVAGAVGVSGGPSSLLQLAAQGLLPADRAVLTPGLPSASPPATRIVTDALRRRDTLFTYTTRNTSHTYTATETTPPDDPHGRGGKPPLEFPPVPLAGNQTVAVLTGAAAVTASSYGSWYWREPQREPVAAFDGDPGTAWIEGRPDSAVGQWIRIEFDAPVTLPGRLPIRLLKDVPRTMISRIEATTAAGRAGTDLSDTTSPQDLNVPAGETTFLRLELAAVEGDGAGRPGAGISEVTLPGIEVSRVLKTPGPEPGGGPVSHSFRREAATRSDLPGGDPEPSLRREFSVPAAAETEVSATAVARPGAALDELLQSLGGTGGGLAVEATSTFSSLPSLRPQNLIDGRHDTAWVAGDAKAAITLRWKGRRLVDRVGFSYGARGLAAAPAQVVITGTDGTRELGVPADGRLKFPPLFTDHLTISFPEVHAESVYNPVTGVTQVPPAGLAEIDVPALAAFTGTPSPKKRFTLECGEGPAITLDGEPHRTSVSGTVSDLVRLRPLEVRLCGKDTIPLPAGTHLLETGAEGPLAVTDLALTAAAPAAEAGPARGLTIRAWGTTERIMDVAAGAASYLQVHQAVNAGWKATLNGTPLTAVTLDGWQQGFVVPAGEGGEIRLWFTPVSGYRVLIGLAVLAVIAVIVLAFAPARRTEKAGLPAPGSRAMRHPGWTVLVIGAIGGVMALAAVLISRIPPELRHWTTLAGMTVAGVVSVAAVAAGDVSRSGTGAFGTLAQVMALVALAAALLPGEDE